MRFAQLCPLHCYGSCRIYIDLNPLLWQQCKCQTLNLSSLRATLGSEACESWMRLRPTRAGLMAWDLLWLRRYTALMKSVTWEAIRLKQQGAHSVAISRCAHNFKRYLATAMKFLLCALRFTAPMTFVK